MLRGFNLAFTLDSPFSVPDKRHGDELFLELLPGTNYVRLVMLHWYDRPTLIGPKGTAVSAGNDCSLGHVRWGEPVISPRCLEQMDTILRWSASQGLWAIVTARCSLAAGEQIPNKYSTNVFGDAEVRRRFLQMWGVVAARYRSYKQRDRRSERCGAIISSNAQALDAAAALQRCEQGGASRPTTQPSQPVALIADAGAEVKARAVASRSVPIKH